MLRELDLNEMEMVSGGDGELPTGGIELWDLNSDRSGSGIIAEGGDPSQIITNSLWTAQSGILVGSDGEIIGSTSSEDQLACDPHPIPNDVNSAGVGVAVGALCVVGAIVAGAPTAGAGAVAVGVACSVVGGAAGVAAGRASNVC